MSNQRILITGASGFIGSKLTHKLVKLGHTPHLLVRPQSDLTPIKTLVNKTKLHYIDIADREAFFATVSTINPHVIYHLAGSGVYSYTQLSPTNIQAILDTNIQGTTNLFQASKYLTSLKVFINTGSSFEYGNSKHPFSETSLPNPSNIYGASKVYTTNLAKIFAINEKLPVITLRPFTVYGPGEKESRFISTVIRQCLSNLNPQLTKQTIIRDYVYIDDLVDAYIASEKVGDKLSGNVFNICTGIATTTSEIATTIMKLTNKENLQLEIGGFPKRTGEVISLVGNPELSKKLLNWSPSTPLKEGIQKTIDWIKQHP